jgi:hypothetical protein
MNLNLKRQISLIITAYLSVLFLAVFGATPLTVQAAGVVTTCTEAELISKLAGGGTVTFDCGANPVTIPLNSRLIINANTTLDGGNKITLDGQNKTGIIKVKFQKSLTLKNITLQNAFTSEAGAALQANESQSPLVIDNVKFLNNVSTTLQETYAGGIFTIGPTITVTNSYFENNRGGNGGAIKTITSNVTVENSTFISNSANGGYGGGAISNDATLGGLSFTVKNSTFKGNSSCDEGGAIGNTHLQNKPGTSLLENVTFIGNNVNCKTGINDGKGGAFYHLYSSLNMTNVIFSGNTSLSQGGGAWLLEAPGTYEKVLFSGNFTNVMGGGLWISGAGKNFSLSNTTFANNRAYSLNGTTKWGFGGGAAIGEGTYSLNNLTIANNTVGWQGGGIWFTGNAANTTLRNSLIANNLADNGGNNWNVKNQCNETATNGGNNLQFPTDNPLCTGGITVADPKLADLADNGGFSNTLALLDGSPAINTGNNATCAFTDQRGANRPVGTNCDIGAFEYGAVVSTPSKKGYFFQVSPFRLYDSRNENKLLKAGEERFIQVTGKNGIPVDATAVLANLGVTSAVAGGNLRSYPADVNDPGTASVNWYNGGARTVSNFAIVSLDKTGGFKVKADGNQTHIIVDVAGYISPNSNGGGAFKPVSGASRLYDSRPIGTNNPEPPLGAGTGKLLNGQVREMQVTGNLGIPAGAKAVIVNLTASQTQNGGFFSLFPSGGTAPTVASLNWNDWTQANTNIPRDVSNFAVVPLSVQGKMSITAGGNAPSAGAQVIVDVIGFIDGDANPTEGFFYPLSKPERLYDSRNAQPNYPGSNVKGVLPPLNSRSIKGRNLLNIPADAKSVVVRITTVDAAGGGFLALYPGPLNPGNSNANTNAANQQIGNLAITALNGDNFVVFNGSKANNIGFVLDIVGYIK